MKIYGLSWHFSSLHFVSLHFHSASWILADKNGSVLSLNFCQILEVEIVASSSSDFWRLLPVTLALYPPYLPACGVLLAFLGQVNSTHHIHIFVLKMQFWYLTFSSILKCLEFKGFFMQILHEHFQIRITYEFLSTSLCMQIHVLGKWRRPTRIRRVRKSTMYVWLCLWHKDNDEFIMKE